MVFATRWRLSFASALTAALVATTHADAQSQGPRVAVGPFSGPNSDDVAAKIGEMLQLHNGEIEAIPGSTYFGVASRLGLDGRLGEDDIARVSREIRADAVIVGDLTRNGRRYALRLRVARGRDGVMVGTINLEFARVGDLDNLEADLWNEMSQHIAQIRPLNTMSSGSNFNGGNNQNNFNNGDQNNNTDQNNGNNGNNGNNDNNNGFAPSSNPNAYPSSLPGLGVIQLSVGAGFSSRSWRTPVLGMASPREYINPGFFEVRAAAHAYLLRFQRDHLGIGLFAQGLIPAAIASASSMTAEAINVRLATSAYELNAGLVVAYLPRGGGAFRASGGFFMHSFLVNTAQLVFAAQYPRMLYLGGFARGEGMVPLVANSSIAFSLLFAGELRLGNVGDEARAAFGASPSMTTAFGGGAGAEFRLNGPAPGLSFRLMADWLRYRTAFSGPARVGTGRDSSDDYLRIHAVVSYAFGVRAGGGQEQSNNGNHEEPAPPREEPPPQREEQPSQPQQPQQPPQPPPPRRDPFAAS